MPTFNAYPQNFNVVDMPAIQEQANRLQLQEAQLQKTQAEAQRAQSGQLTPEQDLAERRFGLDENKDARAQAAEKVQQLSNLLAPYADPSIPELQKSQMWPQTLQQAKGLGLPTDNAPQTYDPEWIMRTRAQVGDYKNKLEETESFEIVKNPYGLGGVAQQSTTTGKISSYQKAVDAGEAPKAPEHYRWAKVLDPGSVVREGESGQLEPVPGGKFDPSSPKNRFDRSTKLRTEFTKASGDWIKIRDAHGRVESAAKDPSAAGDLALIFNYMKVLDPGSVVRESEFATAAASGSWGDRIQAGGLKIIEGERLSPDQRQDFLDRSRRLATAQHGQQKRLVGEYAGLAERASVDPKNVVVDYMGEFEPYGAGAAIAPPVGTIVDGMRFKGGDPREEDSWEEVS